MKYYLVPEEGNSDRLVKIGSTQARSGILIPRSLEHEHQDDLVVTTSTDELGFEHTVVTLDEKKKSERIARENAARDTAEAKQTFREQRKQAEIAKLKSAKPTTLPEALKLLDAIAKIVLSDKGEIDLAEDEASETADSKGRP